MGGHSVEQHVADRLGIAKLQSLYTASGIAPPGAIAVYNNDVTDLSNILDSLSGYYNGRNTDFDGLVLPLLKDAVQTFNAAHPVGQLFVDLAVQASAGADLLHQVDVPTKASLETQTYAFGHTKAMADIVLNAGRTLIERLGSAATTAEINSIAAPIIAGLNARRQAELTELQASFNATAGFFNSNLLDRITEVNSKHNLLLADTLSKLTMDYLQRVDQVAISAMQTLAGYANQPLREVLDIEKLRLGMLGELSRIDVNNRVQTMQIVQGGLTYAADEAKRYLFNSTKVWNRKLDLRRWEAEYYQLLANVPGTGQGQGGDLMQQIANGAMGIGQIAMGLAPAIAALAPLAA